MALLLCSLLGLFAAGLLVYRRAIREEVEETLASRLRTASAAIGMSVDSHILAARRLAGEASVQEALQRSRVRSDRPEKGLREATLGADLLLTDSVGLVIIGPPSSVGGSRQDQPWWRETERSGTTVALPAAGRGIRENSYSVSVSVSSSLKTVSNGTPERTSREGRGVLQLHRPLEELGQALRLAAAPVEPDGRLVLFDLSGVGLTATHEPLQTTIVSLVADPDFRFLVSSDAGASPYPVDGTLFERGGRLFAVSRLTGPGLRGLSVAATGSSHLITDPFTRAVWGGLALIALPLGLGALLFVPFLRKTTADLSALIDYARKTGSRDITVAPPDVRRPDEIGALGAALVGSLEGLRSSRAELERAKKTLEERVATRTAELARVNQELKRRAEELAAASRSKDEFLTNVSHELRTPLNSIIGLTSLVRDGMTDSPEETRAFLDQALLSSRHLLTLINDVLDLAKLEAGKMNLDLTEFWPGDVVDEVRKIVEPLGLAKALAMRFDVPADLPMAKADRVRLRQVLVNVLQNAVKFTDTGQIDLRVRSSDGRRKLLFEIEDTGIGIPKEKRSAVFEKFIQAEAGTTRRFGGTGLGLPISRLLVEAMGGTIGLEAGAIGSGTRVWFTIPVPGLEGR